MNKKPSAIVPTTATGPTLRNASLVDNEKLAELDRSIVQERSIVDEKLAELEARFGEPEQHLRHRLAKMASIATQPAAAAQPGGPPPSPPSASEMESREEDLQRELEELLAQLRKMPDLPTTADLPVLPQVPDVPDELFNPDQSLSFHGHLSPSPPQPSPPSPPSPPPPASPPPPPPPPPPPVSPPPPSPPFSPPSPPSPPLPSPPPSLPKCVDDNESCPPWAEAGECDRNVDYMHVFCQFSCNTCMLPPPPPVPHLPRDGASPFSDEPEDKLGLPEQLLETIKQLKLTHLDASISASWCEPWCVEHKAPLEIKCSLFLECSQCSDCAALLGDTSSETPLSAPRQSITNSGNIYGVQCSAHYNKTEACCGQTGSVPEWEACDWATPLCVGYLPGTQWGTCQVQSGAPVKLDEPTFDETVTEPTSGEDSASIESPLTPKAPKAPESLDEPASNTTAPAEEPAPAHKALVVPAPDAGVPESARCGLVNCNTGERTTIVILSDRFAAIVVAIGSLFMNSPETNIDIWLIGDIQRGDTQAQALNYTSLLNRLETALMPVAPKQTIHVMDIDEATATLEKDGVSPLWKWPQFGSQGGFQDQDHQPPTILHPEPWDYDNMHHDPFNMLRFYLPYLGPFRGLETLFFCDDDIVIQKPIASLEIPMGEGIVIAGTCNGWLWDEDCMRNKPYVNAFSWVDYPVTYLGKDKASGYIGCTMSAEESGHRQCQKDEFAEIIMQWSRDFNGRELNATAQPKWNFGMSRFNMTEWRAQNMTDRFDNYMRANYERKLLPETSLSFGLGISYFAFADTVVCWNSLVGDPAFVDGLGYISKADLNANKMNASKFLGDATVLHWSGRNKPFDPKSEMDPEIYKPFDDVWEWMQENGNIEDFGRQTPDETQGAIRGLLYADQHSGAEWFLELLDETKELCAAGGTANPTAAFAGESFIPPHFDAVQNDIPICALKLSCLWSFVAQNVPRYFDQRDKWCLGGKEVEMTEVPEEGSGDIAQDHYAIHDRHGETLCNWVDKLLEMYPNRTDYTGQDPEGIQLLWRLYEENVFGGSRELVPCTQACGVKPGRMLKYMRTWSQPQMSDVDKSRPMHIQHESQDGKSPKYFIGDFSGANCDGSSLPFGGCTGSENYLPAITWETYKIVELTRWNLVDRCLVESPFARGITEDPTATIDLNFQGERGDIVFDDLLHCMRDSAAQQIADKTRTNVFVNETAKNWKLIHYEYCAVPSHIQPCVDAVVAHVVDKHSVAAQSYNFDPNFAMLDDMSKRRWSRSSVDPGASRRRWTPRTPHFDKLHVQTLAAQWSSSDLGDRFVRPPKNITGHHESLYALDLHHGAAHPHHAAHPRPRAHREWLHNTLELAAADAAHHERTRSTRWLGISNAEEVTAGLIHGGFAIFVQPIYCFAWQKNANGVEISKYLAQLPPQYIVPGSRPFEPFDLKSFTASFDESVDGRTHALIAFGQIDNVTWVQELRSATSRPVVVLGFMRDVLSHRIQAFFADDERRHMANRSSVAFIRAMMHSWMNSDDYPQDAQLQYVYEFNETWRNMTIDALWNARNSSAISSGADADRDSPLASVYLGPVGDPQNIRRSLCIFAHATQLPIPWKIYETDKENRNGIVPSKYIATVDEDVASVLLAKEKREFFFVARALDAFEAFAESYGCLATPTDTAIALPKFGAGPLMVGHEATMVKAASTEIPSTTAPVVQYTRTFVGSVPTDFPLYYFHHVPKTGGTTLSEYLLKLPAMWTVPGSERSDGFNMTRYLAVEDEVCSRMNALIAFSHMQTRTWLNNILPTKLGMRKIETIFMLRDILPHRISFFHEMVGPEAHGADQEELDVGKTVHRPYLEFQEWAAKDDDPKHTNMSWLTNNSGEALDIAPIAVAECIRNKMCRNPRMDDNQLRSIYKLNFAWVKVPVQDFFNQLHAKAPLESCSSSKAVGKDPVFFRHCPNAAADVGLALIGHLALMRETLCLMDRMLGIPVVYNGVAKGGMNWRFKALRPMDAEKSFNSSSAHFLLTRQRRELIFNSMTFATVLEQASAYGCIPPLPAPAPEEPATILPAWAGTAGMEPAWQASSTDEYQCYEPPPMLLEVASGASDSFNALGADDFGSGSGEVLSGGGEVRDEMGDDNDKSVFAQRLPVEMPLVETCNPESCLVMSTGCGVRPECQGCGAMCIGESRFDANAWSMEKLAAGLSVYGTDPVTMVKPANRSLWRNVNIVIRWSEFEPLPDQYVWTAFDSILLDITNRTVEQSVGITFLSGPNYYPQWLFDAPFRVSKYVEVCGKRREGSWLSQTNACDQTEFSVPNFHDVTYVARYKRAHEAVAAKLKDLRIISTGVKLLYLQASLGTGLLNKPVYFNPNRTEADYVWTDSSGQPTPADVAWNPCGSCLFDADAPPRNTTLDALWCPSGATTNGLLVPRRPAFEEFAQDMTAFLYDNVYASLRVNDGLRLMVTMDEPHTWVNLAIGNATAAQTKERMREAQLFNDDWVDSHTPGLWVMRSKEGQGTGLIGERTRVAHSILNIYRVTKEGPVRGRADLDKFWCWTGKEGSRGQLGAGVVAPSCLMQDWHLYATTMWALTIRIDYWNIPLMVAQHQLLGTSFNGVWRFLNRYSGVRWGWQSPGAWIGFRDGLDTLDAERFPEAEYGPLPPHWQKMSLATSQSVSNQAILLYRQRSICRTFQSHGCRLEIDPTTEAGLLALAYGNGTNDVNLDVWRSDYGMYMQRRNTPESKGYWWQGPADQLFGRYSRGFAHPQATIEMVLDQGLWGGLPLIEARNLTLRVVYFDNAIGHFYVGYDALDGPRGWTINTTNTLRWREVTLNITDGRFARGEGGGPNGADVWLRDLSSCSSTTTWENCYMRPTLFDSLEVVELTRDQAIVEPVLKAFINEPSTPTPPELVSEFPAEAPWMPGTAEVGFTDVGNTFGPANGTSDGEPPGALCRDADDVPCAAWAEEGECERFPAFVPALCSASCGSCVTAASAPDTTMREDSMSWTELTGASSTTPGSAAATGTTAHAMSTASLLNATSKAIEKASLLDHMLPSRRKSTQLWQQHALVPPQVQTQGSEALAASAEPKGFGEGRVGTESGFSRKWHPWAHATRKRSSALVPDGREALAAVGEPEVQRMATERPWRRLYRRDGDSQLLRLVQE